MLYGASEYGKLEYGATGDADTLLISDIYDIETIIEDMLRELICEVSPGGNKGIQVVTP